MYGDYLKVFAPAEMDHGPPGPGRWAFKGDLLILGCPNGDGAFDISEAEVREDGTVWPSVGHGVVGCKYQHFVKLEGWHHGKRTGRAV